MIRRFVLAFLLLAIAGPILPARAQEGPPAYFNEDPVLLSRVRKFLDEEEDGRYAEAIGIYREVASYISSQPSNRPFLYQAEHGLYLPVETFLRGRMSAFPADQVALYRREADLQATPQWEEIVRRRDVGRLRDFLRRNALSTLMPQSVEALAGYHVERGEFDEALGILGFLKEPEDWTPAARLLRAVALRASGREEAADEPIPEGSITLGGIERTPAEILADLAEATPLTGWRSFGGDPTHSRVPEPAFDPGKRVASQEMPEPEAVAAVLGGPGSAKRKRIPYFPVHDGRRLILSDTFIISCLELRDGSLRWSRSLRRDRSVPWGHPISGFYPTASRDSVFVTLSPREAAEVQEEGEGDQAIRNVIPGEGFRVMALDIASGEVLWDTSRRRDVGDEIGGAAFVSSPLLLSDRLYILVTRLEEEASASIISLNARTGDRIWETHLCTTFSPMILGKGIHGAYLAGGSGRIYASTNLGAVACLDAVTGGVLWVRAYDRYPAATFADLLTRGKAPPDEAPVLIEGTVFAAPIDSPYLYALEAGTGRDLWRFERAGEVRLVGVRGEAVILSGDGVLGLHRETGKVIWRSTDLPGGLAGKPALAGDLVYIPTARGLFMHRTEDGMEVGQYLWDRPDEEAGNVVFASDRMITVSPSRVNVYEDRGDTLKALAALPEFHARLGEGTLLLRRGNTAKAAETLEQARDLARGTEETKGAEEALSRAYRTLGEIALERGDLRAASSSFEAATAYLPGGGRAPLLLQTGGIYDRLGEPADAVRIYRQLLIESSEAIAATGRPPSRAALVASTRIRRRIESEGRLIYEPYEKEASRLLEAARRVGTLDGFLRIPSAYPNSEAARVANLAVIGIYEEGEEWSLAARHLEMLLRRERDAAAGLHLRLARLYERAGQVRRARKVYRRLAALRDPSPEREEARERLETSEGELADVTLPAVLLWRAISDTSMGRMRILAPDEKASLDVADLFIVAGSTGVEARERQSGLVRWARRGLPHRERQRITLAGDRFFLPDPGGILAVDTATGDEIWKRLPGGGPPGQSGEASEGKSDAPFLRRVAADERYVVSTALPDSVFVLRAADGEEVRHEIVAGLDTERTPILSGGKVIVSLRPAGVALLDLEGEAPSVRYESESRGAFISSDPIVTPSGEILLLTGSRTVTSLRGEDLSVAWEVDYPWVARMVLAPQGGPLILLPQQRGQERPVIRGLDPASGKEIWSIPAAGRFGSGPIAVDADAVYLFDRGDVRQIRALSLADGAELWTWKGTGWDPSDLYVTLGYLVAYVPDHEPPSRLIFINRRNGEEEAAMGLAVEYRTAVAILDDTIIAAGPTGVFGYGRPEEEGLRQDLAALEEEGGDPGAVAATRFALGRREEAVDGLARAILREDLSEEEFRRLFEQMEGYRAAVAESRPSVQEVPRVLLPPAIDGDLKDWYSDADRVDLEDPSHVSGIREGGDDPVPWLGREDLSGRLYMGWDNRYFYFALDVYDNRLQAYDSEADEWKGDCLLIAIDAKNNGGYHIRADDILVTLALQKPKEIEEEDEDEAERPKGKYFVKRKDDVSGVIYEAAIPWEMFIDQGVVHLDPEKGPEAGFTFGFNPVLTDDDGEGVARKVLSWTPGIRVHRSKDQLYNPGEIVPEYYGKVRLK